jgi:hypothetical protein
VAGFVASKVYAAAGAPGAGVTTVRVTSRPGISTSARARFAVVSPGTPMVRREVSPSGSGMRCGSVVSARGTVREPPSVPIRSRVGGGPAESGSSASRRTIASAVIGRAVSIRHQTSRDARSRSAGRHAVPGSPSIAAYGWSATRAPPPLSASDAEPAADTVAPSIRTTLSASPLPG